MQDFVFKEVEVAEEQIPIWDGLKRKTRDMAWCNDSNEETPIQIISPNSSDQEKSSVVFNSKVSEIQTIACPSCGHKIGIQDQSGIVHDLPGLPAGVKFDPSDQEILEHLDAKVHSDNRKLHPLIDEFIPTLEGENGICYTHPEKLPGVSKAGQIRHFFHRPSKAYTTGTRKRRKVHTDDEDDGGETRWHKTGKTRPVFAGGALKGFKKILVLYTNYGRQRKPEKTSWVMHQYHLGDNEEEKDGELVVSKVFYQTQPRQCSSSIKEYSPQKQQSTVLERSYDNCPMIKNSVEYYNPAFISYVVGNQNKENPPHPQLIQNLVVHDDSS